MRNRKILCTFAVALCWSLLAHSHHWVNEAYDETQRVIVEISIEEFRFINPHPLIIAKLTDAPGERYTEAIEADDLWTLEMDNRWELAELGFDKNTFQRGERIIVTVDPSPYDNRALYVRAIEHPRLGFLYRHNVRQLYTR